MSAGSDCICCQASGGQPHLGVLLRCPDCGHAWADLSLTPEQAGALYGAAYFHGDEYLDYEREEPALRRNFRRSLETLLALAPRGGRLFEVGSAYGFFLDEASKHFSVAGCDIAEQATARARVRFGLDVRCADYLEIEPAEPLDVVCLWDAVEHLDAPQHTLAKAHRDLAPGGLLALSTGDAGSLAARMRGPRWRLIHPPTHLHYFTAHSMTVLLRRLGFTVLRIEHPPFWRTADAVAWQLLHQGHPGRGQRAYRALQRAGMLGFSFPMNSLDLMTVYARR